MAEAPAVKQQPGKFTFKDVRMSFPHLFEPKAARGSDKKKFSAALIFPRTHPQIAEIQARIVDVAKLKWGEAATDVTVTDANGVPSVVKLPKYEAILRGMKAGDKLCVHDGDAKSDTDGYAGNLFINASNDIRPLVIGGGPDGRAPLTAAEGKLYAGCYVNAIINVWAQDNEFGKRVNAELLGIQFLRDGERLAGGSAAAADDFEPIPQAAAAKVAASGAGAASLF